MVIELGEMSAPPPVADQGAPRRWVPWVALLLVAILGGAAVEWALRPPVVSFADPVPRWSVVPSGYAGTLIRMRVVGDRVIVSGRDALVAFDLASGAQMWSVPTQGWDAAWLDVVDGVLFWGEFVNEGGPVQGQVRQAVDLESGRILYSVPPLDSGGMSAVTGLGVARFFQEGGRSYVSVLDLRTGAERWRMEVSDELGVVLPTGVIRTWQFELVKGVPFPSVSESEPDSSTFMLLIGSSGTFRLDLATGKASPFATDPDPAFIPGWIIDDQVVSTDEQGSIRRGWTHQAGEWGWPNIPIVVDGAIFNPFDGELIDLETGRAAALPGGDATPIAMGEGVVVRVEGMRFTGTRFDGRPGWTADLGPYVSHTYTNDGHRVAVGYHVPTGERVAVVDLATGAHRDFPGERLLGYGSGLLLVQRGEAVTAYDA